MSLSPDEPPIDVEELVSEAHAFLSQASETTEAVVEKGANEKKVDRVIVSRSDGMVWVDHDLEPEVAHYLLSVGVHQLLSDGLWGDLGDEDEDEDEDDRGDESEDNEC